ncbi:MAG: ATP-binding cassette domain-containing protein [Sideroxyarcus sp.]|nr:ATP-binding cassette domain-containing protein [Sideroxyarcus sp.]
MKSNIVALIDKSSRLVGQHVAGARLGDLERQVGELDDGPGALVLFAEAWRVADLDGAPARLHDPKLPDLPFAVYRADTGWGVIQARGADGFWRGEGMAGEALSLANLDDAECIALPRRAEAPKASPGAIALVRDALWVRKSVFVDAVLATSLVTLLALATSLYAMQVFDRVIPNQGFNTLWVLTVGVTLSICLEFLLKQVRSFTVDRTCNAVDHELSEWFFNRMLGIRMEARPASVGTLASQIKGFELVRGVLASTTLFVVADVPFALFFIVVIGLVGGWVVVVPLITLPFALVAGLMFQKTIQHHTRKNLEASNRKAGLLVEAVDGAEALKSNSAEWTAQSRWNRLVAETTFADQSIRNYTSLSQNFTVGFQQLGYIALVAVGAYFVTENELTMGGLLACSIIGNRAMMPIVQLPGVMVQWALARAAIEGLDQIIALPNEDDEAHQNIVMKSIEGGLRFERTRFAYGMVDRMALEVERLEIHPGARVGLIGAIGSGKSTLLKLASGLYRPAEGKIFLGGVDLALLAPSVVREIIGYLPQDTRLFSGSLRDNLLLGLPDPGEEAILAAAKRTGLIDLIVGQPKGLALEITEGGRGVSGGQKQLIAITRMLLARPKVWLLDEPTGAMDSATEARIVALLRELAAEGATLVVTTHKTALLPLLDRLIVLQGGRLLLDGPRDAVLAKISGRSEPAPQGVAS